MIVVGLTLIVGTVALYAHQWALKSAVKVATSSVEHELHTVRGSLKSIESLAELQARKLAAQTAKLAAKDATIAKLRLRLGGGMDSL